MPPTLTYRNKEGLAQTISLTAEGATVGRTDRCTIHIQNPTVSSQHCRFVLEEGVWYVEDLGSTNGTTVNDQRLEKHEKLRLDHEDVVGCGAVEIQYLDEPAAEAKPVADGEKSVEIPIDVELLAEVTRLREQHQAGLREQARLREQLGAAVGEAANLRETIQAAHIEEVTLREQLQAAQAEYGKSQEQLQAARAEHERLHDLLRASRAEVSSLREQLQEQLQATQAEHGKLREQLEAAQAEHGKLREQLEAARARVQPVAPAAPQAELARRLEQAGQSEIHLEEALQRLTDERNRLREDCARSERKARMLRSELDHLRLFLDH